MAQAQQVTHEVLLEAIAFFLLQLLMAVAVVVLDQQQMQLLMVQLVAQVAAQVQEER